MWGLQLGDRGQRAWKAEEPLTDNDIDALDIATAPRRNSKRWRQETISWSDFLSWFEHPADRKECGNYVLGRLNGPLRNNTTIVSRSAITLDADAPDPDYPERIEKELRDYASVTATTYSSSPDQPRYRTVVLVDRAMLPDEYQHAARALMALLGEDQFDPGSAEPARYMFKPATQDEDWYSSWVTDGDPYPVDSLLEDFEEDLSEKDLPAASRHKRDPFSLEGATGAFNRVYADLAKLVREYELPYEPSGENRWRLVGSRSIAGMGEVAPGFYYSFHTTDPAYGQTCTAFDLVRLHRFSSEDTDKDLEKPVNRRPSNDAMLALAADDPAVRREMLGMAADDFAGDPDDDSDDIPDDLWKVGLDVNARTGRLKETVANWDLIRGNDPVFLNLRYNVRTMAVETAVDLPWRTIGYSGPTISVADRVELADHMERQYRLRISRAVAEDLITSCAHRRRYDPVAAYLTGVEGSWDGTPRLETCLPGVVPTDYTRMVARKIFVAAVARALDPGVKWDHTPTFVGPEGVGKTSWIERMARGFSSTLGRIDNKDTLLAMRRSWIMVADEGYTLRKADNEAMKEFLTRTDDMFRAPYDRDTIVYPRSCVIWSTTNDTVFLRNQEGNRRYLPVHCSYRVDFSKLTDHYVDQVWAEAVSLYRAGEPLYLSAEESARSAEVREPHTEEDTLSGIVEEFLETPVSDEYDSMSVEARVLWLQNRSDGLVPKGDVMLDRVCTKQIWAEAMGRPFGDHRRIDLLEISNVLKSLPGWRQLPGRHRLPIYGPQVVFERMDSKEPDEADLL